MKGRDLFDMHRAISQDIDPDRIMQCYKRYMDFVVDAPPTYKQFVQNMEAKMDDPDFIEDIQGLLRVEEQFDKAKALEAYQMIKDTFIERLKK